MSTFGERIDMTKRNCDINWNLSNRYLYANWTCCGYYH